MDEQGILTVYSLENVAPKGLKPSQKLVEVTTAYYEERQIGVQRVYSALSADKRIDALLRCFNCEIEAGTIVIPNDGKQYTVDIAQKVIGTDAVDLTLVKLEKPHEIYSNNT